MGAVTLQCGVKPLPQAQGKNGLFLAQITSISERIGLSNNGYWSFLKTLRLRSSGSLYIK